MSTAASVLGARVGEEIKWRSRVYKAIVTPVNFVTFLVSLYLVDTRYRAQRQNQHEAIERPLLHRFLYRRRYSPYDWVDNHQGRSSPQPANTALHHGAGTKNAVDTPRSTKDAGGSWFYHTKQKELLKLEAADAFALRDSVLFALCILAVLVSWALWLMVVWLTA
ncbi:hypothetical protein F4801DRAFT_446569 [Xylaria longipes]|nr:hypothetical protein F4801DRAFT_446569 [Xylaria longipes]